MTPKFNLILLGDPASGKDTQASILKTKYDLFEVDIGKALRKISKEDPQWGLKLTNTLDKGKLAPTALVVDMLKKAIGDSPKRKGLIFAGSPKMLKEAKIVSKLLKTHKPFPTLVIYLKISKSVTISRIAKRKEFQNGHWKTRLDDSLPSLRNRIRYYQANVSAVVKFFKTIYTFRQVSGIGDIPEITKNLSQIVNNFLNDQKK